MGYLAIWILCGIAAGIVAESKGRSGPGWLVLGVLLGPFGLVAALGVSNRAEAARLAAERAAALQRTRACPQCAERIQLAAIKCRFCGAVLEPVLTDAVEPAPTTTAASGWSAIVERHFTPVNFMLGVALLLLALHSCAG